MPVVITTIVHKYGKASAHACMCGSS